MNLKTLLILSLVASTLIACDDGFLEEMEAPPEEVPATTYPQKYVYTGVEFNPTEFFRYRVDSFEQFVPEEGELLLADSVIENEFLVEGAEYIFPIKEIEVLSDSIVRVKLEGADYIPFDSTFQYSINNDSLQIHEFLGRQLGLRRIDDEKQLKFCIQITAYYFFNERKQRRDVHPIFSADCVSHNKDSILTNLIKTESESEDIRFGLNDTIILNIAHFVLDLDE